jgi:AcrR family transcriptional regulator
LQLLVALWRVFSRTEEHRSMKTPTPKPRGLEVTKRVLEATLVELGRAGLARLSLPRVAELAGINKTSLYRRWPTKQALVKAALMLAVPGGADGEPPDHGSLAQDLVALVGALAAFLTSPAGMGLFRAVLADGDSAQARRLANSMWNESARKAPRLVVERAIERGELRPDADPELLLYTLAGAVLHRTFVERKRADRRWAEGLVRLICNGAQPSR